MTFVRCILWIAVCLLVSSFVYGQFAIAVKYPTYSATAFAQVRSEGDLNRGPFMSARQQSAKGKELRPFGIFFQENNSTSGTPIALELLDAEKNVSIKKVSLSEYYGNTGTSWQVIGPESRSTPEAIVSVFRIQSGAYDLKLIRELTIAQDRNVPLGKKLRVAFSVASNKPLKLRLKLNGFIEGSWKSSGTSLSISETDTLSQSHPTLVFNALQGATCTVTAPSKKDAAPRFTMTSNVAVLTSATPVIVAALEIVGTSIGFSEYLQRQAELIQSYLTTRIGKPAIVTVSKASKVSTSPGDTIKFQLYSHNIGTAPAVESSLNNLIPAGTQYLEGTAEGTGSTIAYTRTNATPPQTNQVSNITWKYKDPIYPGEERSASFKVLIK